MNFFKYMCLCFAFISCGEQGVNEHETQNSFQHENLVSRALLNGYYAQLDNFTGVSIYNNDVYIFQNVKNKLKNGRFVMKVLSTDKTTTGIYVFTDTIRTVFSNIKVFSKKIVRNDYDSLYFGLVENCDTIWSRKISKYGVEKIASIYKNEFQSGIERNLILEDFKRAIDDGVFFKNESGFSVLLVEEAIYFITNKNASTSDKIMLHLIRGDNTFNNLSFDFKYNEIDQSLSDEFSSVKVAKAILPRDEEFSRIRIGQFNENGNLWMKILEMESITSNKLLRYNNEFKTE